MLSFNQKLSIVIPSVLISVLPFFLITGPFLSDLSLIVVTIFFLYNTISKKDFEIYRNNFFRIFLVFFFYLIINSLIKFYDLNNLRISISYLRFGLFVLAVSYFLDKNEKILVWLFYCFIICFCCLIIDGYIQYFFDKNIMGFSLGHERRVSSFFYDEYILGSYVARLSPIFFGLAFFIFEKNKKKLLIIFLLFIFLQILIFFSGERSAFFYSLMSTIFIAVLMSDFKKLRIIAIVLPIILITLISIFNDKAKKRIVDETLNTIFASSKVITIFSEHHESHYISAYKMYLDNKVVGIGVRNFRNFCNDKEYLINNKSCNSHPHNTYIQLLSETGIVGLSFGVLAIVLFSKFIFQHLKGKFLNNKIIFNNFEICLFASILITIWPFVPTGNFFNNWLSIIYYFPIGFLLWSFKRRDAKKRSL